MIGKRKQFKDKIKKKVVVNEFIYIGATLGTKIQGQNQKKKLMGQKKLIREKIKKKVGGQGVTIHSHFRGKIKKKMRKKYLGTK